jgi:hypothetical protein
MLVAHLRPAARLRMKSWAYGCYRTIVGRAALSLSPTTNAFLAPSVDSANRKTLDNTKL